MTTLTIQDLAHTEALDAKAMTAVRGGHSSYLPSYCCMPGYDWQPSYEGPKGEDRSITATQSISQNQQVFNANGNNVAFADGISSKVKPVQTASNNIFA